LIVIISGLYPKIRNKDLILLMLSMFSFVGIFLEKYFADKLIEKRQQEILVLRRNLVYQNIKIKKIRKKLYLAEQKFKDFYIPNLKEKIFYIWYYRYGQSRLWKAIEKFYHITKGRTSLIGFRIFPSPYNKFSDNIIFAENIRSIEFKPIEGNIFLNPPKNLISNTFAIYVEPFEVDKKFAKSINKIKDQTIKANLLLEYGLLTGKIKPRYVKVPITIIFPLNLAFENEKDLNKILDKLKNFCNILQISSILNENIYTVKGLRSDGIINGICIKYIF